MGAKFIAQAWPIRWQWIVNSSQSGEKPRRDHGTVLLMNYLSEGNSAELFSLTLRDSSPFLFFFFFNKKERKKTKSTASFQGYKFQSRFLFTPSLTLWIDALVKFFSPILLYLGQFFFYDAVKLIYICINVTRKRKLFLLS